jgi:hypothetical protein
MALFRKLKDHRKEDKQKKKQKSSLIELQNKNKTVLTIQQKDLQKAEHLAHLKHLLK